MLHKANTSLRLLCVTCIPNPFLRSIMAFIGDALLRFSAVWIGSLDEVLLVSRTYCNSLLIMTHFIFNSLNLHAIPSSVCHKIYYLPFRELGIGIVPYGPLARGFFGGRAAVESVPSESFLVISFTVLLSSAFTSY